MTKFSQTVLIVLALGGTACSTLTQVPQTDAKTALRDGEYILDQNHAALQYKISHFGISNYTGRFTDMQGALNFDADNPQASTLQAIVDVSSIKAMPFTFGATLAGPDWLDAEQFPQAILNIDRVELAGGNTALASGDLTIKGITQPVTFNAQFIGGVVHPKTQKYTIGFQAETKIKRSDFGITNLLSVAGDKFDFDTVTLEFDGEFEKQ